MLKLLFGLGDTAIQALLIIHPHLTDPENAEGVLIQQGFQYADERENAMAAIASHSGGAA